MNTLYTNNRVQRHSVFNQSISFHRFRRMRMSGRRPAQNPTGAVRPTHTIDWGYSAGARSVIMSKSIIRRNGIDAGSVVTGTYKPIAGA